MNFAGVITSQVITDHYLAVPTSTTINHQPSIAVRVIVVLALVLVLLVPALPVTFISTAVLERSRCRRPGLATRLDGRAGGGSHGVKDIVGGLCLRKPGGKGPKPALVEPEKGTGVGGVLDRLVRERPAHDGVGGGLLDAQPKRGVEAVLAEKGVGQRRVVDHHPLGDGPDLELARHLGRVVLVGGLAEAGRDAARSVGPHGQDEVALHAAGEAHGAPADAVGEREGHLPQEGGRVLRRGQGQTEREARPGAEEALHGYGGGWLDEGGGGLRSVRRGLFGSGSGEDGKGEIQSNNLKREKVCQGADEAG